MVSSQQRSTTGMTATSIARWSPSRSACGNQEVLKALTDELSTLNLDFPSWFKPFNTAYKIPRPTSEAKLRRINGG